MTVGSTVGSSTTTGAGGEPPECSFPRDGLCSNQCSDPRTDHDNCGHCGNACSAEETCVFGSCAASADCPHNSLRFDAESLDASGGSAASDGWQLSEDATLSVMHEFQQGRGMVHIRARSGSNDLRSYVKLTVGTAPPRALRVRSTNFATYSFEIVGVTGQQLITIGTERGGNETDTNLVVDALEIEDCAGLSGVCDGGGYYLKTANACIPTVCSQPDDCFLDFSGPGFPGQCVEGSCVYPSCTAPTDSHASLAEELLEGPSTHVACFPYWQLVYPGANPRIPSLPGTPTDFSCPDIGELTWEVHTSIGEGTCSTVPLCGPGLPENLGSSNDEDRCCYLTSEVCGV